MTLLEAIMYCRSCHYDLRGQEVARCSECGREFDPADPATFLVALPTWNDLLSRIGRVLAVITRKTLCVLVTAILTAGWLLIPELTDCSPGDRFRMAHSNLQHIISTWQSEAEAGRFSHDGTPDRNSFRFESRISPFQHRTYISERRAWVRWIHHRVCWGAFLIMINSLLLALLARGVVRRFAWFVAPLAVVALVLGALAQPLSERIWRGDHKYLSDYSYVPIRQWPSPGEDAEIVAWPVRVDVGRSWGAYSDGTVRLLEEEYLEALVGGRSIVQDAGTLGPHGPLPAAIQKDGSRSFSNTKLREDMRQ